MRISLSLVFKWAFVCFLPVVTVACTAANTRYQTSQALKQLGFKNATTISRSERWVLAGASSVLLSYPMVGPGLTSEFPRLRNQLAELWLPVMSAKFQRVSMTPMMLNPTAVLDMARSQDYDILLQLRVMGSEDHLSSVHEWWREGGIPSKNPRLTGRDRLQVTLEVIDARTGRRLDTLQSLSVSRRLAWGEVTPAQMIDEAVGALELQLQGHQVTRLH